VRADEVSCPFCSIQFHPSRRDEPEYVLPPKRLSRQEIWRYRSGQRRSLTAAAVFAAGGALALEMAACSSASPGPVYGFAGCLPDTCIDASDRGKDSASPRHDGGTGSDGSTGEGGTTEGGGEEGGTDASPGEGGDTDGGSPEGGDAH
jgi:hypothetical protein